MKLEKNKNYHGFILQEDRYIDGVNSQAYLMEHEQSGAKLLYLKNSDKNKVFSVSFKTPPTDHTGVAHILEHSVLCGSKKYTAKDPFNELAKGSLNTYLNAMTFSDKTMYPVASCNEQDYHNLMDVYLDAVFFPNIYNKKEIFMQEGWRYFFNEEDKLDITGVVYNEMQGALADPESKLSMEIAKVFYGDTTYGFESGGDPIYIPDLTYEDFLNFHKTNYHPCNSYIYVYGDLDIDRTLKHINEGYLDQFNKDDIKDKSKQDIKLVSKKPEKFIVNATYPAQSDDEDEKGYLVYTFNIGKCVDLKKSLAMQILSYCLLESNASPIKTELLKAGICHEVEGWLESSNYEVLFSIVAKNSETDKVSDFEKIIKKTLENIIENGLDKKLVRSCLKRIEFLIKEDDYGSTPKGLVYNIRCMKTWLYKESPFTNFYQLETLNLLKDKDFSWENFIKETLFDNDLSNIIVFTPELGKEKIQEEKHKKMLEEKQADMSVEEKQKILEDMKALDIFQTTEETEEVLNQIPFLKLDEVSKTSTLVDYRVKNIKENKDDENNKEIYVPLDNNDIVYIKMCFDTKCVPNELLPYCGLLTEILGRLDTKSYNYETLPLITNEVVGSLSFDNSIYNKNVEDCYSFVVLRTKFLFEDFENAQKLFEEILFYTDYNKLENLIKILQSTKVNAENYLMSSPHLLAIYHSNQYQSLAGHIQEKTKGITYVHFVSEICKILEDKPQEVIDKLKEVAKRIFTKENFSISYACGKEYEEKISSYGNMIFDKLEKSDFEVEKITYNKNSKKTAFYSPMQVQYNILAGNFEEFDTHYSGGMEVLRTILNLEYLWNQVRVQGGAYGAGSAFRRTGNSYFYSYRDPNLENTFNIYKNLANEIKDFDINEKEMTKYILGTINNFDQPKSNSDMLADAMMSVYTNFSDDDIQKQRNEILSCTNQDIKNFAPMLEKLTQSKNYTTVGNNKKIEENKEYFDEIKNLIP